MLLHNIGDFELVHELAKLGYIDGKNISYDMSGAEGDSSRLPQLALELVAKKPDVLVGSSSKVAVALRTQHVKFRLSCWWLVIQSPSG